MDALIDVAMTRLFRLAEYVCDRMAVKPAEYVYGNAAVKPSGSVCDVAAVKPAECVCDRGSKRTGSVCDVVTVKPAGSDACIRPFEREQGVVDKAVTLAAPAASVSSAETGGASPSIRFSDQDRMVEGELFK